MSLRSGRIQWQGRALEVSVAANDVVKTHSGERATPGEFSWLPPATGTVIGVALNLATEVERLRAQFQKEPYKSPAKFPVLFIKPANTLCGHLSPVQQPRHARAIQPGAALAVVIGRRAFRVPADDAWDCVAGYTLFNDFSLPEESFFRPPVRTKCFDSFGPMGPCIASHEAIEEPRDLVVRTFVNGKPRQENMIAALVHDIPALIAHITAFMTLEAGDVLVPAIPAERIDVVAGDTVVVEAAGVGRLENTIVSEENYYAGLEVAA